MSFPIDRQSFMLVWLEKEHDGNFTNLMLGVILFWNWTENIIYKYSLLQCRIEICKMKKDSEVNVKGGMQS